MIVVVAEKPSVARDLARSLKCRDHAEGYYYNGDYAVTWALGHLVALCDPDELEERYKKWRMEDLPILPDNMKTKVLPKTRSQFSVVKKLMLDSKTDSLVCATDAGREGELIFRLIYEKAGCKKPFRRLWISSMTDEAIREGLSSLRPGEDYDGLFESALCRAKADWLVGMNASRAYTLKYNALLSLGRVQTPTLAILARRAKEIRDFKPEEYYTLTADFGDYKGQWFDEKAEDARLAQRIQTRERAEELQKKVKGKQARVVEAQKVEKKELPPLLYDLTSLQRDANRLLSFTAQKTLKIAQSLYEDWKILTYPRTDSKCLPKDMIPRVEQTVKALPALYQPIAAGIPRSESGKLPFRKAVYDDAKVTDHHALLPTTKAAELDKLPAEHRALYDLVVRRMLAAFYPAFEYDALRVITESEGERFRSTGRVVTKIGWKAVYEGVQKEEDEPPLPALSPGDERQVKAASVKKETTKPPAPHTDASLLYAMEYAGKTIEDEALREQMKGSGLGTPATRAAIIERLIKVGYAARRGRALTATEKGERLISIAPSELTSPETTARWEQTLEEIADKKGGGATFLTGIRELTTAIVSEARGSESAVHFEREQGRGGRARASAVKPLEGCVCPLCGKPALENSKAFGCSAWREGCNFTLWKDCLARGGGPALSARIVKMLLTDKQARGSTGTISLEGEEIIFRPADGKAPIRASVRYVKKK